MGFKEFTGDLDAPQPTASAGGSQWDEVNAINAAAAASPERMQILRDEADNPAFDAQTRAGTEREIARVSAATGAAPAQSRHFVDFSGQLDGQESLPAGVERSSASGGRGVVNPPIAPRRGGMRSEMAAPYVPADDGMRPGEAGQGRGMVNPPTVSTMDNPVAPAPDRREFSGAQLVKDLKGGAAQVGGIGMGAAAWAKAMDSNASAATLADFDAIDSGVQPTATAPMERTLAGKKQPGQPNAIVQDYRLATPQERQAMRVQQIDKLRDNREFMDLARQKVGEFERYTKEQSGDIPNFSDIRTVADFRDWMIRGGVQTSPTMAASMVGALAGLPGLAVTSLATAVGDMTQARLLHANEAFSPQRFGTADRQADALEQLPGRTEQYLRENANTTAALAPAYAALEFVPGGPAKTLAAREARGISKQGFREIAKEGVKEGVKEFGNEAGQEVVNVASDIAAGDRPAQITGQDAVRVFNAGMMGFNMGVAGHGANVTFDAAFQQFKDARVQSDLTQRAQQGDIEAAMLLAMAKKNGMSARDLVSGSLDQFHEVAAQRGVKANAVKAAEQAIDGMPASQVPGFLSRYIASLQRNGLAQPADPLPQASTTAQPTTAEPAAAPAPVPQSVEQGFVPSYEDAGLSDRLAEQFGVDRPAAETPQELPPETGDTASQASEQQADVPHGTPSEDAAGAVPQVETPTTPLDEAAHEAATSPLNDRPEPTDAQKTAGNYKMGHVRISGMDVSIENPQGSVRRSKADDPTPWEVTMPAHYGYIKGTEGSDGDHVDLFIGPAQDNGRFWVINQTMPDAGTHDEHKVITGVNSADEAVALYKRSFSNGFGDKVFGSVSAEFNADQIKARLPSLKKAKPVIRPAGQQVAGAPAAVPAVNGVPSAGSGSASVAPAFTVPPRVLARAGRTPNAAHPIELRPNADGTLTPFMEGKAMLDFNSGEPIVMPAGISDLEAKKAIRAAGAVSSKTNFFPVGKGVEQTTTAPASEVVPAAAEAPTQSPTPVAKKDVPLSHSQREGSKVESVAKPQAEKTGQKAAPTQKEKRSKVPWSGSEPRSTAAGKQSPYADASETSPGRGTPIAQGENSAIVSNGQATRKPVASEPDGSGSHQDLSRVADRIMRMGYERQDPERIQAARRLAGLIKRLGDGKLTQPEFEMAVRMLAQRMDTVVTTKAANRLMSERERGADYVRERLIRARRQGDLDADTVDFALWALDQNPALAANLAVSVRSSEAGSAGDYNPADEIIRLFKGHDNRDTAVHEILHHAERMMPHEMQSAVREAWAKALAKAVKSATPEQKAALENIGLAMAGDTAAYKALTKAIQQGPLNYDEHYQLVNPSEFWAVNASRLLGRRFEAKNSVWARAANWLREMAQKIKDILGLKSDAPLLRALDHIIDQQKNDGEHQSKQMLSDRKAVAAMGDVLSDPVSPEVQALRALRENDELFALPKSTAKTIEGITADNDPTIKVRETKLPGNERMWTLTMEDGRAARITVRKPSEYGPSPYSADFDGASYSWNTERPGENPEAVDPSTEDVWIDVSALKGKGDGAKIYNIASTFAHNTGRIFIGDPNGVSADAMRRRPQHMLSSALKFGTTAHLAPHPDQVRGNKQQGIPPLKWVYGDDLGNIRRLVDLNLRLLENDYPEAKRYTFDAATGRFSDTESGESFDRNTLREAVAGNRSVAGSGSGQALAGGNTIARAVVLRSLLREASSEGQSRDGGRDDLLARLVRLSAVHPDATSGLFYDLSKESPEQRVKREALERAGLGGKQSVRSRVMDAWGRAADMLRDRGNLWSSFVQGNLDQFHGIQKAVQHELGNLPAEQDPYIAARLANGGTSSVMRGLLLHGQARWAANGLHLEKIPGTEGLLDILAPLGDNVNDWFGWMIGNRAALLKAEGRERNFTDEQIKALQSLIVGKEEMFREASKKYAAFKRSVLDVAEQAGLINKAGRAAWDNADYIPFYRQIDNKAVFSPTGRKGLSGQSSGIRQLKGGTSSLNDPVENILMNFSRLIDASLKNNAIRKTQQALANSDVLTKVGYDMKADLMPTSQVKKLLVEHGTPDTVLDAIPPSVFDGMAKMWAIQAPSDPDVVRIMVDGKPEFYRVNDPLLLKSLTSFVPFDFPGLGIARACKRVLTRTVTATPEFMLRNFIRDSLAAHAITRDGFNPVKSLSGIVKSYTESGAGEAMLFAGASFQSGNINAADPTGTANAVRRALRQRGMDASSSDKFIASIIDTPAKAWEAYRHIGEAIENANREAIYEATVKAGKSVTQAAYEAKDMMDFTLRGSSPIYQVLTDVLPFFNARVQGLYRLGRSDPKRLAAYGALIAASSLLLAMANSGQDWYDELPDWDKDTYWHFMLGGHHFRIPKPFELGVAFATIPERIFRYMKGLDRGNKTLERLWANVRDQLSMDPVPQAIRPALNAWANKDTFRDRPIENQSDEGKLPHMRYSQATSETTRVITKVASPITDPLGLGPKKLEYLIDGYFGTAGAYALGLSDMAVREIQGHPPRPSLRADDIPVVKAFYRVDPARGTVFESDLYKMRQEVDEIYRSVNALRKDEKDQEADAMEEKNSAKLDARRTISNATRNLAAVNRDVNAVMLDPGMTPEQKRKELDSLQREKNQIAKEAVKDVEGAF